MSRIEARCSRPTREGRRPPAAYAVLVSAIGALALVAGVLALVTGSAALLATLAASMAGLWLIATARHALASGSRIAAFFSRHLTA